MKPSLCRVFGFFLIAALSGACRSYNYYTAGLNKTNMSQYKTFALMEPEGQANTKPTADQATAEQKIKDATVASLKSKGLKLQKDNPDLLVVYTAKVGVGSRMVYYYGYPGWGWGYPYYGWGWGYGYTYYGRGWGYPYYGYGWGYPYYYGGWGYVYAADREHYKEGTIIIDLIDARTHKVVWRGFGVSEVHSKQQKNIEEMPTIVQGIIDQLQLTPEHKSS
jgi:hypothetical protein